jgi:hypothetical protein
MYNDFLTVKTNKISTNYSKYVKMAVNMDERSNKIVAEPIGAQGFVCSSQIMPDSKRRGESAWLVLPCFFKIFFVPSYCSADRLFPGHQRQ